MLTAVPPYIDSHIDDQNPFTGEFTLGEIWIRLHRCKNTAPRSDGISCAQWKKIDRGGYALNTAFNVIHRLGYIPQA
jgi:hypothetical protein